MFPLLPEQDGNKDQGFQEFQSTWGEPSDKLFIGMSYFGGESPSKMDGINQVSLMSIKANNEQAWTEQDYRRTQGIKTT